MPMPNYHSVRVHEPSTRRYSRFRYEKNALGPGVDVLYGIRRRQGAAGGRAEIQAIRFSRKRYTPAKVRGWLRSHPEIQPLKIEWGKTMAVKKKAAKRKLRRRRRRNPNGYMERLYKAVKKHSGMDDEQLVDAANHGADAGWPGFTYYTDTSKFYEQNEEDIWAMLDDMASNFGSKNVLSLIAGFGGADSVSDDSTFKNLLSWAALEEVGRYAEAK